MRPLAPNPPPPDSSDLTLPLFQDIGWHTQPEDILFIDGFDPNPCAFVQP
jgi:hypothetical protein